MSLHQSFSVRTTVASDDPAARLIVFGLRRMGAHGLADANAAHAFMTAFGKDFRRPLILQRTWVAEMSLAATQSIQIAPWCCPRMTPAEATLVEVLARAPHDITGATLLLSDLIGAREASRPIGAGVALASAFADLALPIGASG